METLFKNNFRGGAIRSSDGVQEWQYRADGTLKNVRGFDQLEFRWNGETLSPSVGETTALGSGAWNGVWIAWLSEKRMPLIKYFWMNNDREFVSDVDDDTWQEEGRSLRRKSQNMRYLTDGEVPVAILMLIELLSQCRQRGLLQRRN
jgi:hypothetical protein